MKDCRQCHHKPSCRFDANGWQCYCECHDRADNSPERISRLKGQLRGWLAIFANSGHRSPLIESAIRETEALLANEPDKVGQP